MILSDIIYSLKHPRSTKSEFVVKTQISNSFVFVLWEYLIKNPADEDYSGLVVYTVQCTLLNLNKLVDLFKQQPPCFSGLISRARKSGFKFQNSGLQIFNFSNFRKFAEFVELKRFLE